MKTIMALLLIAASFAASSKDNENCVRWEHVFLIRTDPGAILLIPLKTRDLYKNLSYSIKNQRSAPATNVYQARNVSVCDSAYQSAAQAKYPYGVAIGVSGKKTTAIKLSKKQFESFIHLPGADLLPE